MTKVLYKFYDGVFFVSNKPTKKRGKSFVKWLDGYYYEADTIVSYGDENLLNQLANNLNNNWPRVYLSNYSG